MESRKFDMNSFGAYVNSKIALECGSSAYAIRYFITSSCMQSAPHNKVLSLIALSEACFANEQYLIALKIVKIAFKISNGFMLPQFDDYTYKSWRKMISKG